MGSWSAQRQAALSGIVFVVLVLIGGFAAGSPPKVDASPATILRFYADNDQTILVGGLLMWLGLAFFLWFASGLSRALRAGGQDALGTLVIGSAIAAVSILAMGTALNMGLVRTVQSTADVRLAQSGYQTLNLVFTAFFWVSVALVAATALGAARGVFPAWYGWLGWAVVVLMLLGGISVRHGGALSPTGAFNLTGLLAFAVWVLASSVVLWRTVEIPAPASAAA